MEAAQAATNCLRQIASFDGFVGTSVVKFLGYIFIIIYKAQENYRMHTYVYTSLDP